jgi:hypothetical protein
MIRIPVTIPNGITSHAGMSEKVRIELTLDITVTFNIINLLKVDSSYNEGMKP